MRAGGESRNNQKPKHAGKKLKVRSDGQRKKVYMVGGIARRSAEILGASGRVRAPTASPTAPAGRGPHFRQPLTGGLKG